MCGLLFLSQIVNQIVSHIVSQIVTQSDQKVEESEVGWVTAVLENDLISPSPSFQLSAVDQRLQNVTTHNGVFWPK
jgi:hypothetical protein